MWTGAALCAPDRKRGGVARSGCFSSLAERSRGPLPAPRTGAPPRSAWRRGRPCRRRGTRLIWCAMALAVSAMIGVRARPMAASRLADGARGGQAVHHRHLHVHQDHVAGRRPSRPRPPRAPFSTTIGSTPIWCSRVFSTSWLTGLSSAASTRRLRQRGLRRRRRGRGRRRTAAPAPRRPSPAAA